MRPERAREREEEIRHDKGEMTNGGVGSTLIRLQHNFSLNDIESQPWVRKPQYLIHSGYTC